MSIKSYVEELEQLKYEIKCNNDRNKIFRTRIKELEKNITEYLIEKGQHGLKYKGKALLIEEKKTRIPKKKKQKENDIINFFNDLGISNPKQAYGKLLEVQQGIPIQKTKIKIQKINKI